MNNTPDHPFIASHEGPHDCAECGSEPNAHPFVELQPYENIVLTIARQHVKDGDADIGPAMLAVLVDTIDRLSATA